MGKDIVRTNYRIELGHPYRPYGIARLSLGLVLLAVTLPVLSSGLTLFRQLVSGGDGMAYEAGGSASHALSLLLRVVFGALGAIIGLASVIVGAKDSARVYLPAKVPADFREPDAIARSLESRELPGRVLPSGIGTGVLRMARGDGVDYIPPALREVAVANAGSLLRSLIPLGLVAVLPSVAAQLAAIGDASMRIVIPFPTALVTILLVAGASRLVAALMLVPTDAPDADFERATQELGGSGHPSTLLSKLEVAADAFRYMDIPNRIYLRQDLELASAGVADTGKVVGGLFFETQPVPADDPPRGGGYVLLGAGVGMVLTGVLLLVNVPSGPALQSLDDFALRFLPGLFLYVVAGCAALASGTSMLTQSRTVLARFRFRSDSFLVQFGGTYYRSEVGAGMATSDSLRSTSLAVRTELVIRYSCASLLSESVQFRPRELIAAGITDELRSRLSALRVALEQHEDRGAKLVGIDFEGSAAVARLASANVSMTAAKAAATSLARSTGQIQPPAEVRKLLAPGGPPASETATVRGVSAPHRSPESYITELERLGVLHEKGILTDEEFAAKKRQLLGI